MSKATRADFAVANWWARLFNERRFRKGKSGRHRSFGLSTAEWARMEQIARVNAR